jgi:hypothetical protein
MSLERRSSSVFFCLGWMVVVLEEAWEDVDAANRVVTGVVLEEWD